MWQVIIAIEATAAVACQAFTIVVMVSRLPPEREAPALRFALAGMVLSMTCLLTTILLVP